MKDDSFVNTKNGIVKSIFSSGFRESFGTGWDKDY
jgi:hypothetical protein